MSETIKVVVRQDGPIAIRTDITPAAEVTVRQDSPTKIVQAPDQPYQEVVVKDMGPPGPPGPQGEQGPPGETIFPGGSPIDAAGAEDEDVLVYKELSDKWIAAPVPEHKYIEGGHF